MQRARPDIMVETKPGGRGDFRVVLDGKVLWDKRHRDDDRFPADREILAQLPPA